MEFKEKLGEKQEQRRKRWLQWLRELPMKDEDTGEEVRVQAKRTARGVEYTVSQ